MSKYETTFVVDSLRKSEEAQNILTKVQNFIKNNGGEIDEVEDWGKKRLAYEVNRKQYGNYYQVHFEGPSNLPGLLEREYRLEEAILRFLTIISDPKAALAKEASAEAAKETKVEPEQDTAKTQVVKETAKVVDTADVKSETDDTPEAEAKSEDDTSEKKDPDEQETVAIETLKEEVKETEESETKE